jgi:uncharacterized OB-fold protein
VPQALDLADARSATDVQHMMEKATRPMPAPDAATEAFWRSGARGRLLVQQCRRCGNYDHPPFPECTRCRSADVELTEVSGRGTIFERAIVSSPVVSGFEEVVPYVCLVVELDEQPGLLVAGNLVGVEPAEAVIGRRVVVQFEALGADLFLPVFRLEESS